MEYYKREFASLFSRLQKAGYPDEALVSEWPLGEKYRADLAVIDRRTSKPVAVFEMRKRKDRQSIYSAYRQLLAFRQALGGDAVPLFAVFQADPGLEILRLPPAASAKLEKNVPAESLLEPADELPAYELLRSTGRQKAIARNLQKRSQTQGLFTRLAWGMAAILIVLLALDFKDVLSLTTERLAIIGAVAGLIILPFASRIKFLGMEFDLLMEKRAAPTGPGRPEDLSEAAQRVGKIAKEAEERLRGAD